MLSCYGDYTEVCDQQGRMGNKSMVGEIICLVMPSYLNDPSISLYLLVMQSSAIKLKLQAERCVTQTWHYKACLTN
jgi:hypothetical protein